MTRSVRVPPSVRLQLLGDISKRPAAAMRQAFREAFHGHIARMECDPAGMK